MSEETTEEVALMENKDTAGWKQFSGVAPGGDTTVDFSIEGTNCQVVTVMVPPGQKLVSEPGAYMFMSNSLELGAHCAPSAFTRCCCMFESCFQLEFDNVGGGTEYVGLTPTFPAKVVALDLGKQGKMIVKNGGYMAGMGDVAINLRTDCCSKTCCCSGLGCCQQLLSGDGTAFIAAGGTIMEKDLAPGEVIRIDNTSILGFSENAIVDMECQGCCACCCGKECCFTVLKAPPNAGTKVYMQSMNFEKYKLAVRPPPPPDDGGNSGGP